MLSLIYWFVSERMTSEADNPRENTWTYVVVVFQMGTVVCTVVVLYHTVVVFHHSVVVLVVVPSLYSPSKSNSIISFSNDCWIWKVPVFIIIIIIRALTMSHSRIIISKKITEMWTFNPICRHSVFCCSSSLLN